MKEKEERIQKRPAVQKGGAVPSPRRAQRDSIKRYLAYAQRLEEIRRL